MTHLSLLDRTVCVCVRSRCSVAPARPLLAAADCSVRTTSSHSTAPRQHDVAHSITPLHSTTTTTLTAPFVIRTAEQQLAASSPLCPRFAVLSALLDHPYERGTTDREGSPHVSLYTEQRSTITNNIIVSRHLHKLTSNRLFVYDFIFVIV